MINPDVDSITLNCSENILLSATANPFPGVAQLMPDTQIVTDISGNNSFLFDFNSGQPNGATYSLYDSPERTYYLECTGLLTDTSIPALNYDAAFMDWPGNPTAQNSIWSWNSSNGGTVPLLGNAAYDGVNHTYTWSFPADGNLANPNGVNTNLFDHEFIVKSRRANYQRWLEGIKNVHGCHALFPQLHKNVVPYVFPLVIDSNAIEVFHNLKLNGVPLWRWEDLAETGCATVDKYRLSLLQLPCHQDLSESQMDWMIDTVTKVMTYYYTGEV